MNKIKFCFLLTSILFISCSSQIEFSENLWKNFPLSRKMMTESLILKLTTEKPSKSEVISQLGSSAEENMNIDQGKSLVYFIRSKTIIGLKSDWLFIEFKNDRVINAYLAELD